MKNKTGLDSRQKMLQINNQQKDFYESRFDALLVSSRTTERAANMATNLWTQMRRKVHNVRRSAGVDEHIFSLHRQWMHNLKNARVLDLGCFTGNDLSLWIAENCADYIGIDLSEQAIEALNVKLRERGLHHARGCAQDFLTNSYPVNYFDLIYAHSVLHHFKDMSVLLEELHRILKPGGMIISLDPMMTEPFNRLARVLYRPLQTDRHWEWPFTRATFRLFQKHFEILEMQGFMGMVKLSFPFQIIPGLNNIGKVIERWGLNFDNKHARSFGIPFFLCWFCTLQLRKPDA